VLCVVVFVVHRLGRWVCPLAPPVFVSLDRQRRVTHKVHRDPRREPEMVKESSQVHVHLDVRVCCEHEWSKWSEAGA
jgi:hypothetical protein